MDYIYMLGTFLWVWLGAGFLVAFWVMFVEKEKSDARKEIEKEDFVEVEEDEIVYNIWQSDLAMFILITLLGFVSVYGALKALKVFFLERGNKKR